MRFVNERVELKDTRIDKRTIMMEDRESFDSTVHCNRASLPTVPAQEDGSPSMVGAAAC